MIKGADKNVSDEEALAYERESCPTCGSCSGMFTANSMNCLTEALGLSLPGNGTLVATHADRKELFLEAGRRIVDLTKRYYEKGDESALPRSIANFHAFENAMTLDIAMGGSTNTVLHLLAAARRAAFPSPWPISTGCRGARPACARSRPSKNDVHLEDVHRAGGIMAILGELDRAGLIHRDCATVHAPTVADALYRWDIARSEYPEVEEFYRAAPGGVRTTEAFSQSKRADALDLDRAKGVIRSAEDAFSQDGGLAVLYGNIATDGCIVKTAGVDESCLKFSGPAVVCESQEEAVSKILGGGVKAGEVVVIRYEGPIGGPGMQEMLYPTSYLKSVGLGKQCALITDGRFSGGTAGLSICHVSPEAAEGGAIALIEPGDIIEIDIPGRSIDVRLSEAELAARRTAMEARGKAAWQPVDRERDVSQALKVYAAMATSAARGAVRDVNRVR